MNVLVLITGTGRSGTSTMSGSFHHLGLHVPGPYLGANESNPKGFFESSWSVKFHKEIVAAARIHEFDSRPDALERVRDVLTPAHRDRLVRFLEEQAGDATQVVVKDPRSVWAQALWREAAAEAGFEIRYVSMLRHPAEVIGSRATYYASKDAAKRRRYEAFNVARWVNNSLISERETRGHRRAFVGYSDLLDDWRPVLIRLGEELGLSYDADLSTGEHHAVDDFIDPGLRRHRVTWDDLEVPTALREIAEEVWRDVSVLGETGGVDDLASSDLDRQAERYAALLAEATAIAHDAIEEEVGEARLAGAAKERERLATAGASTGPRPAGRLVEETGGRDLLKVLASRAARKVRRR